MPRLSDAAIEQALTGLEGWQREGDELVREFTCADFVAALGGTVVEHLTSWADLNAPA